MSDGIRKTELYEIDYKELSAKVTAAFDKLQAERDRYRDALRKIYDYNSLYKNTKPCRVCRAVNRLATQALEVQDHD